MRDSNPRPTVCKTAALATAPIAHSIIAIDEPIANRNPIVGILLTRRKAIFFKLARFTPTGSGRPSSSLEIRLESRLD